MIKARISVDKIPKSDYSICDTIKTSRNLHIDVRNKQQSQVIRIDTKYRQMAF